MSRPRVVVPKHRQVFSVLRERILEGRFAGGLPGEHPLAEARVVPRVTLRRAMDAPKADGLIARERGRGTRALPATKAAAAGGASGARTDISGPLDDIVSGWRGQAVRPARGPACAAAFAATAAATSATSAAPTHA